MIPLFPGKLQFQWNSITYRYRNTNGKPDKTEIRNPCPFLLTEGDLSFTGAVGFAKHGRSMQIPVILPDPVDEKNKKRGHIREHSQQTG